MLRRTCPRRRSAAALAPREGRCQCGHRRARGGRGAGMVDFSDEAAVRGWLEAIEIVLLLATLVSTSPLIRQAQAYS